MDTSSKGDINAVLVGRECGRGLVLRTLRATELPFGEQWDGMGDAFGEQQDRGHSDGTPQRAELVMQGLKSE